MSSTLDAAGSAYAPSVPRWALRVALGAAMGVGGLGLLWVARHVHPDPVLHEVALFCHLACLVVGFGAVLAVDWQAALWLLGRRELTDVLGTATHVHVPIWGGYLGLVVSGTLLAPDVGATATQVKLGLVLALGWNGLLAGWFQERLEQHAVRPLVLASAGCAAFSQLGWWSATAIGFLNAR